MNMYILNLTYPIPSFHNVSACGHAPPAAPFQPTHTLITRGSPSYLSIPPVVFY